MKRIYLNDRQCHIFLRDMIEFGYSVTYEQIRRIADQVTDGTHSTTDPIALIMCRQIDEATELRAKGTRPEK